MNSFPRPEYEGPELSEQTVAPTPLHQLLRWYHDAVDREEAKADIVEPSAMSIASVGPHGEPHVRVVLMRFLDTRGPGFVSQLGSQKAIDFDHNPNVAASLTWLPLFRAVHIRGVVEVMPDEEIEQYWRSRPFGAKMTAIAVEQSRPIASRDDLELRFAEAIQLNKDTEMPQRPQDFAGWRIRAKEVEFWSGRPHRLHDRLLFTNPSDLDMGDPGWRITRLMP